MDPATYLDCEFYLAEPDQARLSIAAPEGSDPSAAGQDYVGRPTLGEALYRELLGASLDAERYGSLLFDALFPKDRGHLLDGYREGLAIARYEKKRLRLRLHISASCPELHTPHWELLYDPKLQLALGRCQEVAFSRYLSVPWPVGSAAADELKLLVAIADPRDLAARGLPAIDREVQLRLIDAALRPLSDRVSYETLDGPATPGRIRARLLAGGFHVLHLCAHGLVHPSGSVHLVLEAEDRSADFTDDQLVAEMIAGQSALRLVTLMACHGDNPCGPASDCRSLTGLGPALVRRGLPAVIAMRKAIRIEAAGRFTRHLYADLARGASVDQAVGEARQQLYLAAPESVEWGTPALYMRLEQGLLWDSKAPAEAVVPDHAGSPSPDDLIELRGRIAEVRQRGRAEDLATLEAELGDLADAPRDAVLDLYHAYRALQLWDQMIDFHARLPGGLRRSFPVREQLAFAHNRRGDSPEAIRILEQVLNEQGPSCETYGLLGRVYKDLWGRARKDGRAALASGYLDKAIATYVRGFETDWRDAYPGVNAVTLLDVKGDAASLELKSELVPLVRFAVKQRLKTGRSDYWDHATLLELAVLDEHEAAARRHLADALVAVEESWEPATTAGNLRLIQEGRRQRGHAQVWLDEILAELAG